LESNVAYNAICLFQELVQVVDPELAALYRRGIMRFQYQVQIGREVHDVCWEPYSCVGELAMISEGPDIDRLYWVA
jgi:hypothetical protein